MKKAKNKNPHTGSSFDDFLAEEGILEETTAIALKRVIARQLEEKMKLQKLTKSAMARQMNTSRTQLDRLLDPTKTGVSLETLVVAAETVGCSLRMELF